MTDIPGRPTNRSGRGRYASAPNPRHTRPADSRPHPRVTVEQLFSSLPAPLLVVGGMISVQLGAVGYGSYIACGAMVGRHTRGNEGLALAMIFGTVLVMPVVRTQASSVLFDPLVLAAVAGIAMFSSLVPNGVELEALRRITPAAFGVLMSLEPAFAAVIGEVLLGEALRPTQWAGICVVVIASAGRCRGSACDHRASTSMLRDEQARAAPPLLGIDLDRRTVILRSARP